MNGRPFPFAAALLPALIFAVANQSFAADGDKAGPLFDRLTAHAWTNHHPGEQGHQEELVLRRDGKYHWERTSDYTERNDKGKWNLVASGADAGLVRLSDSGDLPFVFEGQNVRVGDSRFNRGQAIEYSEKERKVGLADLQPVVAREPFRRLAATAWVKTNPFDDYRLPDRIEFSSNGRYTAQFRGGDCKTGGTWGILYQRNERLEFVGWPDVNDCDRRGGTAGLPHGDLTFSGDLLLLGAPYAAVDKKPAKSVFVVDQYGGSMQTRGEFAGPFVAGRPVRIDFTHESASGGDYTMKSLEIGFQKLRIVKRGGEAEGEIKWVAVKDLKGSVVSAPLRHSIEVTPPHSGEVGFFIRPTYSNTSQKFDAYQWFHAIIGK